MKHLAGALRKEVREGFSVPLWYNFDPRIQPSQNSLGLQLPANQFHHQQQQRMQPPLGKGFRLCGNPECCRSESHASGSFGRRFLRAADGSISVYCSQSKKYEARWRIVELCGRKTT